MKKLLSFDDVLVEPRFSFVNSRQDVCLGSSFMNYHLDLPIISSNMDTVTESAMATAMGECGGVGALHRFSSIEDNIRMFKDSKSRLPMTSLGLAKADLERASALYSEGCRNFVIDVAHGASMAVVRQYEELRKLLANDAAIMVGNFATAKSIDDFIHHKTGKGPDAWKIGIGGGSMCTTRVVTGCGMPTLASVQDCARLKHLKLVADGGMRTSGDIAKALAAGASAVMLGGMLAGTDEAPGEICDLNGKTQYISKPFYKKYRGSASMDSYKVQGKVASHRSPEGEATYVPYKGSVKDVIQQIEGGLRSALSYVGANNLVEFREKAHLVEITGAGALESKPHGVK